MFSASKFEHIKSFSDTDLISQHIEPISTAFNVKLCGEEIPVYTCRISKYPLNRVWPGFQRPFNQTRAASFVNIVSDENIVIEVTPTSPCEKAVLKPLSKKITLSREENTFRFTLENEGSYVFETDDRSEILYIFNSKPITCPNPQSVTRYFGKGVHFVGKVELNNNDTVYVDKDALVFGCFYADNAKGIRIFGNGLIDDSCEARPNANCYANHTNGNVKFYNCTNLKIEGILMRDSAIWCVNLFHCFDVKIDNIKVFGQWKYNTDGIDVVNCQNVSIKNSFIHSFDDTITIKGIDHYIKTDNVDIHTENCVLWCDWGKTCEIGIETSCREYKNISFKNCDILRGGNTVLDIQNGDCAQVHDIVFEDIRAEYNSYDTPEQYQLGDAEYVHKNEIGVPHLIKISNHRYTKEGQPDAFGGPPPKYSVIDLSDIEFGGVYDIVFKDIKVYYDERILLIEGKYNIPIETKSHLEGVCYRNISVENVSVNGKFVSEDDLLMNISDTKNFTFK